MKNGLIIDENGCERWYKDDLPHREDGPAIMVGNHKSWYLNGKRHRIDGPAIEWAGGGKSWYLNDEFISCKTNEEFLRIVKLKAFL